jgi:hypothetical protein
MDVVTADCPLTTGLESDYPTNCYRQVNKSMTLYQCSGATLPITIERPGVMCLVHQVAEVSHLDEEIMSLHSEIVELQRSPYARRQGDVMEQL